MACNYGHESGSEEEEEEVPEQKRRRVDGELDTQGRMVFHETREQREAREKEKRRAEVEEEERRGRKEVALVGGGGRKKRLALPGGRATFNVRSVKTFSKADLVTEQKAEEEEAVVQERMAR